MPAEKRILVIKIDAIGDYVLFRNYLKKLIESEKFKGFKVDLLGNILWKDLAEHFDNDVINNFIFINSEEYYEKPVKTLKLGWRLYKSNYSLTLQPTFSRTLIGDGLAALTASPQIIGYYGNEERIFPRYKVKTDKFYTSLLKLPANSFHELERNHYFFEEVLAEKFQMITPRFNINPERKGTVLIFPGSGAIKRNWEPYKFKYLIENLLKETPLTIILMGSNKELELNMSLMISGFEDRIINLTGNTTLIQTIELVASSALVIANETSAIHIAAACNTPSLCILGGGHFNRFTPYPSAIDVNIYCIKEVMPCYNCNWACSFTTDDKEPYPCISSIDETDAWEYIKTNLKLSPGNVK